MPATYDSSVQCLELVRSVPGVGHFLGFHALSLYAQCLGTACGFDPNLFLGERLVSKRNSPQCNTTCANQQFSLSIAVILGDNEYIYDLAPSMCPRLPICGPGAIKALKRLFPNATGWSQRDCLKRLQALHRTLTTEFKLCDFGLADLEHSLCEWVKHREGVLWGATAFGIKLKAEGTGRKPRRKRRCL